MEDNIGKTRCNLWLSMEVIEDAKHNPNIKSLSEWVNDKYTEQFMNEENATLRLEWHKLQVKNHEKTIAELQKRLKELEITASQLYLSPTEKRWLKMGGVARARKFGAGNVLKSFAAECHREDLSLMQFLKILDLVEKEIIEEAKQKVMAKCSSSL